MLHCSKFSSKFSHQPVGHPETFKSKSTKSRGHMTDQVTNYVQDHMIEFKSFGLNRQVRFLTP